jgi:hypothetical protein
MAKSTVRKKGWGKKEEVKNKKICGKVEPYSIFKPRQLPHSPIIHYHNRSSANKKGPPLILHANQVISILLLAL